jgi:hypothetical protein
MSGDEARKRPRWLFRVGFGLVVCSALGWLGWWAVDGVLEARDRTN